MRLGKAGEVVSRLEELAQVLEVPFAQARARHAIAVIERDPAGLDKTSRAFEEMGSPFLAAEAAADEAVVWRRRGEDRKATAAQRRSESLQMRCEGVRSPALSSSTVALATLSPRELEIASLAANGLSNREIASRLVLSHRTVENQLHSAYAKLGVAGRTQLAEALHGSDARAEG